MPILREGDPAQIYRRPPNLGSEIRESKVAHYGATAGTKCDAKVRGCETASFYACDRWRSDMDRVQSRATIPQEEARESDLEGLHALTV